jgi:hypothetical protein
MTAEQEAEKTRRLRLLESAAASAILNGATVEEVHTRVNAGVDDALENPIVKARAQAA